MITYGLVSKIIRAAASFSRISPTRILLMDDSTPKSNKQVADYFRRLVASASDEDVKMLVESMKQVVDAGKVFDTTEIPTGMVFWSNEAQVRARRQPTTEIETAPRAPTQTSGTPAAGTNHAGPDAEIR